MFSFMIGFAIGVIFGLLILALCVTSKRVEIKISYKRNEIVDEFAEKLIERLEELGCEAFRKDVFAIAKEVKGEHHAAD